MHALPVQPVAIQVKVITSQTKLALQAQAKIFPPVDFAFEILLHGWQVKLKPFQKEFLAHVH